MSIFEPARSPWPERLLSILRVVAGLMFLQAGTSKLFGWPPIPGGLMPEISPFSQIWIGAVLEVVGGLLIIVGFLTRPTAFILSGEMAVAYFQFHQPSGFWPTTNGGVAAALYSFLFLYFVAAGAGIWSIDAALTRGKHTTTP